jgi:cell division protein FtsA
VASRNLIVGLDVGTTKTAIVIGELYRESQIHVLGLGTAESQGLNKGQVIDIDLTSQAINQAAYHAERAAGVKFQRVCVGIAGGHLRSRSQRAETRLRANETTIAPYHIDRVIQATANVPLPTDREIVAVIPKAFSVDDLNAVANPTGLAGRRLGVETHVVSGTINAMDNLENALRGAQVGIELSILQPLASAQAALTLEQRRDGVVLVDIGGGTTDIAVFMDDNCWNIEVLPAGGMQVTSDISRGLRLPMKVSEDIKLRHGRVDRAAMEDDSLIDVPGFDRGAPIAIRRKDLAMVIEARMAEILERVRDSINSNGFHDLLPAGVVLTGGGSQLQGLIQLANNIIGLPVTLGRPPALWGLDDEVRQPEFCTGIGLMLAGLEARAGTGWLAPVPTGLQAILSNIQEWGLKLLSPKPGWEPDS